MSIGDNTPIAVHEAFAQIANADIEALLKQLTQDEKVALLTGLSTGSCCRCRQVGGMLTVVSRHRRGLLAHGSHP
jgi:hypothetical protein